MEHILVAIKESVDRTERGWWTVVVDVDVDEVRGDNRRSYSSSSSSSVSAPVTMDRIRPWIAYFAALPWMFLVFFLIPTRIPTPLKIGLALANAGYALLVCEVVHTPYAILDVIIRLCFGYCAMKTLDLGVARAYSPPILLAQGKLPVTFAGRLRYAWHLTRETRYESFSISVAPPPQPASAKPSRPLLAAQYVVVGVLNLALPLPEVRVLGVLLTIYTVFELGHSIIRPDSRAPLFNNPVRAPGLAAFWRKHWHAIILSPLSSLAFEPFGKLAGRGAGVLAAFTISGAWHAWAVLPVGGAKLAVRVFAVFIAQAGWMSVEWAVWGKKETWLKRASAWAWCLAWSGWALRGWDSRAEYGLG
jgi:hypothetical protein